MLADGAGLPFYKNLQLAFLQSNQKSKHSNENVRIVADHANKSNVISDAQVTYL